MTREEAISKIKAWDFLDNDEKEALETLIPELKESEDEKIRKELIEHIKSNCETGFILFQKFSPDDVIAWLEKQKEHEPTDLDVLNYIRKETCCDLAEANNALLELIKVLKEHPSYITDKSRKLRIEWEDEQ